MNCGRETLVRTNGKKSAFFAKVATTAGRSAKGPTALGVAALKNTEAFIEPVFEYDHKKGLSITGATSTAVLNQLARAVHVWRLCHTATLDHASKRNGSGSGCA